ncbi:MAG: hypothetical protein HY997_18855 [Mycolicibacterium neoaurum]|nr:hypothetical protein [Mycolicibacterium neoaurum]
MRRQDQAREPRSTLPAEETMSSLRRELALAATLVAIFGTAAGGAGAQSVRPAVIAGSYLPLQPGNHWQYEKHGPAGVSTWEVSVAEPGTSAPQRLYDTLVGYFRGPRQVREDPGGNVLEWSGESLKELLWYPLDAPVGFRWDIRLAPIPLASPIPDCVTGSKLVLASRVAALEVAAGTFSNVIRVDWESPCADAGITSEWFAPGVGLIRRDETTFAGPVSSELVRADLAPDGLPRVAYATTLGLEAVRYVNDLMPGTGAIPLPSARGFIEVRNFTDAPLELSFSGCKSVTVELLDEAGTVVAAGRGDDGGCCTCTTLLPVVVQGGAITVPFSVDLAGPGGTPLPDGRYSVLARLDSLGAETLRPSARAPIEIVSVH